MTNSHQKNHEDDEEYDESRDRMAIFSDYDNDKKATINDVATSPMNFELKEKRIHEANMHYNFEGHQFFA